MVSQEICSGANVLRGFSMSLVRKILPPILVGIFGWTSVVRAQVNQVSDQVDVITTIEQFWTAKRELKEQGLPYRYEFDVLYYDPLWRILHVSDGNWVEYVSTDEALPFRSGDRVVVTGKTRPPGDEFWIRGAKIEVIGKSQHEVIPINLAEIDHRSMINEAVEFTGLVHDQGFDGEVHMRLNVASDGYAVTVWVPIDAEAPVPQWVGSVVSVRGVYGPKFEPNGALRSLEVFCPGVDEIVFKSHISESPEFEIAQTKVEDLAAIPPGEKVRLLGEVVGGESGKTLFLRDETGQVTVELAQLESWEWGETVEVVGVPEVIGIARNVKRAWVRPIKRDLGIEFGMIPNQLMHRVTASVRELTPAEAAQSHAVQLEGVVTWSHPRSMVIFVQDATGGIKVKRPDAVGAPPLPGTHVRVKGHSAAGGFAPQVEAGEIRQLGEIGLPAAKKITLEQAQTGVEEAQWVEMTGYVYTVRREAGWVRVELSTNSGPLSIRMPDGEEVTDLVGTVASFEGVVNAVTNENRKLVAVDLWVPDRDHVEIFDDGVTDVFELPVSPLSEVGLFSVSQNPYRRIKVSGTVLHWSPRGQIVLEDGDMTLLVLTRQDEPLSRGEKIEVAGFYGQEGGRAVLREGQYRQVGQGELSAPDQIDPAAGVLVEYDGHLVSVDGELIEGFQLGGETRAAVQSGRTVFEVRLEDSWRGSRMRLPVTGSLVRINGVYVVDFNDRADPVGFHILLGESDQIEVLEGPQWWTPQRVLGGVLLLVGVVAAALFWVRLLHVRVTIQTRQIEEQMQRATQLEADLNRAARLESLGTLASGIAQDFSTLLTAVHDRIGSVAAQPNLPVKVRAQLDEARASSLRARDLAHQLSAFSERAEPLVSKVDMLNVLQELIAHVDLPHSIVPRWQKDDFIPEISSDANMLRQVFQNLFFNSTQAMPKGGELGLNLHVDRIEEESDSLLDPGEYLRVQVRDSGEGIAGKNIGRVFDPYFTTRPGAQGLGLSVVYSLVRRLRGKVIIESTPMVGTTVTIWLPLDAPAAG